MDRKGMTLAQHLRCSRLHGDAGGGEAGNDDLIGVLTTLAAAAKRIAHEVSRAALAGILGYTGARNVQGEDVRKLDELAHVLLIDALRASGHVCALASEEAEHPLFLAPHERRGPYVVLFDPLDGSSNIDAGLTIGTIFSVYRAAGTDAALSDLLQTGSRQVAAGYALYGTSTSFVCSAGDGVHGYTLDPDSGEFRLTAENLRMPERGAIYSANEANYPRWCAGVQRYIDGLKTPTDRPPTAPATSARWWRISTARSCTAACSCTPPTRATPPTASCGCSTRRRRWRASPRRRAAAPAPATGTSWRCRRPTCTSGCRCSSAAPRT